MLGHYSVDSHLSTYKQDSRMLAVASPRVFHDITLRLLSGTSNAAPSSNTGINVVAMLGSDQRGPYVEFLGNKDPFKSQCCLQRCQIFRVGPALQLWVVDDETVAGSEKVSYSETFTLELRSEEASNVFFNAVQKCNKGSKLANGSVDTPKEENKFDKKIEASSAKMYFHYYGQLLHQQNMLQDYVRTGTYYAAVLENRADFQGRVVVDVGAGSGILSLFAAQAGARHVYAVEASSMADYAQKLIAGNPALARRITVIHGKVEDVELPEKADMLISEPMGTLLVNERMLESYIIARDRFLVPGGKMFPGIGRIHMAPFSDEYLFVEIANKALFWQQQNYYGVDLTPLHNTAFQGYFSQPVVDAFDPRLLIAPPAVHTLDLTKMKEEDLYEIEIPLNFTATMAARVHGLACWFDVLFNGSTIPRWLTTAPGAPTTHWYQLRLVLSQPLYVMAGQAITARLQLTAHSAQSYTIHLTMSAASWGVGAGEGGVMQSSSGKFDLKEPYYRMSQMQTYTWAQDQQNQQAEAASLLQQPIQAGALLQQQVQQSQLAAAGVPQTSQQQQQLYQHNYW